MFSRSPCSLRAVMLHVAIFLVIRFPERIKPLPCRSASLANEMLSPFFAIGPHPMNLQFWPGAVGMMLIATMTAALVTNSGRSAWFVGVLIVNVYLIFAISLYLLPPAVQ